MGEGHSHNRMSGAENEKKIAIAVVLTGAFMMAEVLAASSPDR